MVAAWEYWLAAFGMLLATTACIEITLWEWSLKRERRKQEQSESWRRNWVLRVADDPIHRAETHRLHNVELVVGSLAAVDSSRDSAGDAVVVRGCLARKRAA